MEKSRWELVHAALKQPQVDFAKLADEVPDLVIMHSDKMQRFRDLVRPNAVSRDTLENYWIYGPTGTGKSRKARSEYGPYYVAQDLKWFPSPFNYEDTLIIDEVVPGTVTFRELSMVADHYPFTPPYKGGFHKTYRPKIVIVTSNYSIEQCFPADHAAITRRFKQILLGARAREAP